MSPLSVGCVGVFAGGVVFDDDEEESSGVGVFSGGVDVDDFGGGVGDGVGDGVGLVGSAAGDVGWAPALAELSLSDFCLR